MKTGKCYLGLIIIGILCAPVLGKAEPTPPGELRRAENEHLLIAQSNPNLKGIKQLYIIVRSPTNAAPVSHGITFEELENSVKEKIEKAGIAIAESDVNKPEPNSMGARTAKMADPANARHLKFRDARTPELRIDVDSLDIKDSNQVVFYVKTSLARLAYIGKDNRPGFKTDVWQSEPIMRTASTEGATAAVTSAVLEQVEAFIHTYLIANSLRKRLSDANGVSKAAEEQVEPAVESTPAPPAPLSQGQDEPAKYKYVASKSGNIFHKPDCVWVKRIKPENLINYSSRDEAVNAGKKPCKLCNP